MIFNDLSEKAAIVEAAKSATGSSNPFELERLLQVLETCIEEQALVIQSLATGEEAA